MICVIKKILIANRGEIAVRIIRACREMGIETVAVYSEADAEALHTKLADEAVCIGPAPSSQSYLSMENIISATVVSGADAIHPGFGFLSENSKFAELCEQCGITFIGPPANVIAKLGNKQEARNTMEAAGVPVIPGSKEPVCEVHTGLLLAREIGYPVIIKAALGGGGKGMRTAWTPEEFESLNQDKIQYSYSWVYDKEPKNEKQEKKMSEDLMEALGEEVTLESFVPQYLNQAITFTGDDMGSDRAMITMLLYMIIVIIAFVFGITISNTIRKEAGVIGTLRASGYTRKELIGHYMALPVIVTLIGAVIGNILGYTALKKVCAGMYYGSYSLPTYVTVWNAEAFWMTTVVPVLIMLVVNYGILRYKLRLSPLKFLRRDLSGNRRKRAVRLSPKLGIFHRFRLRVIFQNMSNYIVLFIGIIFANLLLFFGLLLPSVLSHYQQDIQSNMLAKYQYMLEVPVSAMSGNKLDSMLELLQFSYGTKTENEDAEAFSAYSLETLPSKYKTDEVILYGIKPDSKYIDADLEDSEGVYISSAYAEKFLLKPGDSITLKEKYEKTKYTFKVKGIYKYSGGICVFMPQEQLNDTFDLGNDYFSGYFSNSKIKDIDEKYIGSVLDLEALTKISRQLDVSMGNMMGMVNAFAIGIYMVVIYLLSKIIIEKNAQAISMTKILGYTNGEISRLYIWPTTIVVVICLLLSLPIEKAVMNVLFREMMLTSISGWIALWIDPKIYVEMFLIGIGTYAVVAMIEYRRIKHVPMDEALKNVE